MNTAISPPPPVATSFKGCLENLIIADVFETERQPCDKIALLSHGGGQTRHSWGNTAATLAANGWTSITIDQRGHGDSDWASDAQYGFDSYAADLASVALQVKERFGVEPVSIGASLGGLASLIASGENQSTLFTAVVLVDITPKMKPE